MNYRRSNFDQIAQNYHQAIALINSFDQWIFERHLPGGRQRVLDIGCGSGFLLERLSKYFKECYGIDNSKAMIKLAQKRSNNFKLTLGDANQLPYQDEYFDYVVSQNTFHHLDREKATGEAKRVLKRGGKLVIVDVALEENKLLKLIKKITLRYLWSYGRMVLSCGLRNTIKARAYVKGPEWRKHLDEERSQYFTKNQFKDFFSKMLPGVRFGVVNHPISYVSWTKR